MGGRDVGMDFGMDGGREREREREAGGGQADRVDPSRKTVFTCLRFGTQTAIDFGSMHAELPPFLC